LVQNEGSDLYLTVGAPPAAKFQGILRPLENVKLMPQRLKEIAHSLMTQAQINAFETNPEPNLALSERGVGRFRVNIFRQRDTFFNCHS
jgi:twitching motility protein PilU